MAFDSVKLGFLRVLLGCAILLEVRENDGGTNTFADFVREQGKRQYSHVPREVLAFYYPWYGQAGERNPWREFDTNKHTISGAQRYPVKGPYSSHDVEVIDWQIEQAKGHGLTGFIVSYWTSTEWEAWNNRTVVLLLERAEKKGFKIALHWEVAPGSGEDQINGAVKELSFALKEFASKPAFLRLQGKPVIFAYAMVMNQVPTASWPKIIEGTRARAGDFVLLADGHQKHYGYVFDGIYSYDLNGLPTELERKLTPGNVAQLASWAGEYYARGVQMAREQNRISCLMVMPGIDSRKAYKFDWQMERLNGQTYRTLWEAAIRAGPDWMVITSWNEWPEGTEIEPSLELKDEYLKITDEFSRRFRAMPAVAAPAAVPLPTLAPGSAEKIEEVLAGRKVALLNQERLSDAEFWAAFCGATIQRVSWQELVEPRKFSAREFTLFIHVASEHYTSTVKTTDDVMRALVRYLREGGFLVSVPSLATWPLLYDDSRKGVPHGISDRLALGIDNGFDHPPVSGLNFHARTNALLGLRLTAPYPQRGDLRFRPATKSRVPATELYVPLIQLMDANGTSYGDAVSYIEHRAPSLNGGKSIYAWKRTAEIFGPEVFFPSLYQLVSTRLKPIANK